MRVQYGDRSFAKPKTHQRFGAELGSREDHLSSSSPGDCERLSTRTE